MRRDAFALPLVLWSVAFLAGLSLLLLGVVSHWLDDQSLAERRFAARQNALTGIALGMNPAVLPGDPLLRTGNAEKNGHEVRISDESARINPNYWLKTNQREGFQNLLGYWQVEKSDQDKAIDGMTDWTDADDFVLLNGAERGQYEALGLAGFPPNEPFNSVDELSAVIGLQNILAEREGWRDFFTVWHDGKIGILHASSPVLEAVGGLTEGQAEGFLKLRAGPDGIKGTEDDEKFAEMADVVAVLNANANQAKQLEAFFSLGNGARRVESTGWAEGASYQIAVIVEGQTGSTLLNWEEQ